MNRKQFLILVLVLVVLGGAGLAMVWQDIATYRESGARIGARLLPQFQLAEVAQMRLRDGKQQVTLVRKDTTWTVRERGNYPASFQEISDLMVKLAELKVTQSEQVGPSLLPRVELVDPDQAGDAAKPEDAAKKGAAEGTGTLIEFKDAKDKPLARIVLGKKVLKKDPMNPLPSAVDGVPAGRYVLGAKDTVVVVSDPLNGADATPGKWLNKTFIKVDRIRTLTAGREGAAPSWKITRAEEWGQWKFASGGGDLAAGRAVAAVNALGSMSFTDVVPDPKPEDADKPVVVVAETFDNLTYTMKLAKQKSGENYVLNFTVTGEPPKARPAEKGEKPEQKDKRDKEFADTRKRLESRIMLEQVLSKWTYVIGAREAEPLLRERADMIARKPDKDAKGEMGGGMPGMPGFPFGR